MAPISSTKAAASAARASSRCSIAAARRASAESAVEDAVWRARDSAHANERWFALIDRSFQIVCSQGSPRKREGSPRNQRAHSVTLGSRQRVGCC